MIDGDWLRWMGFFLILTLVLQLFALLLIAAHLADIAKRLLLLVGV